MRVDAFDFHLPEDRIALAPIEPRDAARLLHVGPQGLADRTVRDLPELLSPGDVLIINDTKVIAAELEGVRRRGDTAAKIALNLHKRLDGSNWIAFARPAKRMRAGDRIVFEAGFHADVVRREDAEVWLRFSLCDAALDTAIAQAGNVPLPPYITSRRPAQHSDETDYQTIFAREPGAVAAPTAGLHFSGALVESLKARGVVIQELTLHVGAGTFLPVKVDDTDDHRMHAEIGHLCADTAKRLNRVREAGHRIVAVGTTSLRLLESAADQAGYIHEFHGETDIFITPGYRFRAVDALITNFHLPRSTLFMLVAAFSGLDTMQKAYAHAIAAGYRFYSFGDACFLEPAVQGPSTP